MSRSALPQAGDDPRPTLVIRVRAVPAASRDAIAGVLGDRLKVRVSAPPEGGRANRAIVALLSGALGIKPAQIGLVSGHASAEKTFAIIGLTPARLGQTLGIDPDPVILPSG